MILMVFRLLMQSIRSFPVPEQSRNSKAVWLIILKKLLNFTVPLTCFMLRCVKFLVLMLSSVDQISLLRDCVLTFLIRIK